MVQGLYDIDDKDIIVQRHALKNNQRLNMYNSTINHINIFMDKLTDFPTQVHEWQIFFEGT